MSKKQEYISAAKFAEIENVKKYEFLFYTSDKEDAQCKVKIIKAKTIFEAIDYFIKWMESKKGKPVKRVDYEVAVNNSFVNISETKLENFI